MHILSKSIAYTFSGSRILSKASEHGLTTVKQAAYTRKKLRDSKNIDVTDRLEKVLDSPEAQRLVWHKTCNAHFTDRSKLESLQKSQAQAADSEPEASCSDTNGGHV